MGMDFVTDLPDNDGYDSIVVFVDLLTKMVHLAPNNKTDSAQDVAHIFIDTVFKLHGLPEDIVSDRDPKFTSNFWQAILDHLGTKQSLSSAFHPQSDAM